MGTKGELRFLDHNMASECIRRHIVYAPDIKEMKIEVVYDEERKV